MTVIHSLLAALDLAFQMFWDTWWALVLGFTITGAVEEFVSEDTMTDYLGGNDWDDIGRGMAFGAASSSCSFSAVSTTKTLFKKGASPSASIGAFQFAATDLVVEMFLIMWILLGWQFVAAEIFGSVVCVLILAAIFKRVPDAWWERAREHVYALERTECAACGMEADPREADTIEADHDGETHYFCCGGCLTAWEAMNDTDVHTDATPSEALTTKAGWRRASSNTMREWDMLWEDLLLGFVIAGFIGVFVPTSWWATLFPAGDSFTIVLWGAIVGVVIGVATFLCSVGNIPFALVLWSNGMPFGAILSFIYADLIIPPLTNAYRKYYGLRAAGVIFLSIAFAAVVAGVLAHYVFGFLGAIPHQGHTSGTAPGEYTLLLNLIFTPIFVGQVTLAFGRDTVGDWVLARIAGFGEKYWWVEQRVGTATEVWERTRYVLAVVAAALVAFADAVAEILEEIVEGLDDADARAELDEAATAAEGRLADAADGAAESSTDATADGGTESPTDATTDGGTESSSETPTDASTDE